MSQEDVPKVDTWRDAEGVTVFTMAPEARPDDMVAAFAAFMREGPTPLVLWDLRQSSFGRIKSDELHTLVHQLVLLSSGRRSAGRSAFVVAHDLDFGVTRMIITYAELNGYGVSQKLFRDVEVARAWLRGAAT